MKKILYIRQNKPGGTDNYCKHLYAMFEHDTELQPLPVEDLPAVNSRLFHCYYKPLPLAKAINEADIIHINGYTAMGTVQALYTAHQLHKTIVYTAHWHPFQYLRHPFLGKLFFHLFIRPAIRKYAHVVTTINNDDTCFFHAIHPNVIQIPHWFESTVPAKKPTKKPNMILFVGRADDPVKGLSHLYSLPEGQYEVHCVGPGHIARQDFHQHVNISDAELASLYMEAALLVIPSKYEAFSYAALEAMTYGTPVLMSERVRIADYLQGLSGYQLFRYGDTNDFLQKVTSTIGTKVDADKVCQTFAPARIEQLYKTVYRQ